MSSVTNDPRTPEQYVASIDAEIERLRALGKRKRGDEEHYRSLLERCRSTRLEWVFLFGLGRCVPIMKEENSHDA